MRFSADWVVLRWALLSRLAVWLLGAVSHALVTSYDASASLPLTLRHATTADAETTDATREPLLPGIDAAALRTVGMFANWDAVFFVRLAETGHYPYEHFHAFLPLLPLAIRGVCALSGATFGRAVRVALQLPAWSPKAGAEHARPLLSLRTGAAVAGFVLCNACFVASALLLLRLGRRTLARTAYHQRRHADDSNAVRSSAERDRSSVCHGCHEGKGTRGSSSCGGSSNSGDSGNSVGSGNNGDSERQALLAALLYCFTPASVFFSAVYTESPFAMCSFGGMLLLARAADVLKDEDGGAAVRGGSALYWRLRAASAACFGCAGLLRSNGIVLVLFLAWASAVQAPPLPLRGAYARRQREVAKHMLHGGGARLHAWYWLRSIGLAVLCVLPSFCFHVYGWLLYCGGRGLEGEGMSSFWPGSRSSSVAGWFEQAEFAVADGRRPWCTEHVLGGVVPPQLALYSFVQRKYWGVGFFAYYEWKQLPNFALAAPAVVLSVAGLHVMGRRVGVSNSGCNASGAGLLRLLPSSKLRCWAADPLAPQLAYWALLLLLGITLLHVQVTTRFLCSACPAFYWFAAELVDTGNSHMGVETVGATAAATGKGAASAGASVMARRWRIARVAVGYFLLYNVLGPLLFCNFYPWT